MFKKIFQILNLVVILSLFIPPVGTNLYTSHYGNSNDEILRDFKRTGVGSQTLENGLTERITFGYDGISQSNGESGYYSCCGGYGVTISGDGRYIAFESTASNLVANDTNGFSDIFLYDRQTGITKRISNGINGEEANESSRWVSISTDGSRLAFSSIASNLVEGDTNGSSDVFVYDNNTGKTTRVSINSDGSQFGYWLYALYPSISGDGDLVAFETPGYTGSNGYNTVVVHKISTGETKNIVMSSDGVYGNQGGGYWSKSSLSFDGRYISFDSNSDNLVPNDTNNQPDVFVRDLIMGVTTRISVTSNNGQATGVSWTPSMSGNGRYIVFYSGSSELVSCTTYCPSTYIHDMLTGTTTPVDIPFQGTGPNGVSSNPSISLDGRFVSFESNSTNLVPNDTRTCLSNQTDCRGVFIRDLLLNQTSLISVDSNNIQANDRSFGPAISSNGTYVAFESIATNIVSDDTNGYSDIFLRDRGPIPQSYSISGQITDAANLNNPIPMVTISDGVNHFTTTNSNGTYTLSGFLPGSYTIIPSLPGFFFEPAGIPVTINSTNVPDQDFVGHHLSDVPIILLPGILGSRLFNDPKGDIFCYSRPKGEIWLPDLFPLSILLNGDSLFLNPPSFYTSTPTPANPCDRIYPSGIFDSGINDKYGKLKSQLTSAGYPVFEFSYDWRLDLETNATLLDAFINNLGLSKVTLIGHSMGGMLARVYIGDATRARKVAEVISVGTPYWGSPKTALTMRSGLQPMNITINNITIFNENFFFETIARIARYSPAAMELLPSEKYFTQQPFYYVNIDRQLIGFDSTKTFFTTVPSLWGLTQDNQLIESAKGFQRKYTDFSNSSLNNVQYHILAANHLPTISSIREYPCVVEGKATICFGTQTKWGDDTVPFLSASMAGQYGPTTHLVTFSKGEVTKGHGDLLLDPNILSSIKNILSGKPAKSTISSIGTSSSTTSDYFQISLIGPAKVSVRDSSNHFLGIDASGLFVNEITGSDYELIHNQIIMMLPADQTYELSLEENSGYPIQMSIQEAQTPSSDDFFSPNQTAVFCDIPSFNGAKASLSIDPVAGLTSLQLGIDINNDGISDETILPSSILNSEQSQDITMPQTTIVIQGSQGWQDFYTGTVTATLSAIDDETGVLKTEYSLNGGDTWNLYEHPVSFVAEQTPVFCTTSVDKAGNQEFPWKCKRLQPYTIYLPVINR